MKNRQHRVEVGEEGGLGFLVTVAFLGILEKEKSRKIQHMPKEYKKNPKILETMKTLSEIHLPLKNASYHVQSHKKHQDINFNVIKTWNYTKSIKINRLWRCTSRNSKYIQDIEYDNQMK